MTGKLARSNGILLPCLRTAGYVLMPRRQVRMHPKVRRPTFIRAWRLAREMSLEELASAAKMAAGNLSKIERGLAQYTQDILERLADQLHVSPAELIARGPDQQREMWMILNDAPSALREHVLQVAEKMVAFQPAQPLDGLLPSPVSVPLGRVRRNRRTA